MSEFFIVSIISTTGTMETQEWMPLFMNPTTSIPFQSKQTSPFYFSRTLDAISSSSSSSSSASPQMNQLLLAPSSPSMDYPEFLSLNDHQQEIGSLHSTDSTASSFFYNDSAHSQEDNNNNNNNNDDDGEKSERDTRCFTPFDFSNPSKKQKRYPGKQEEGEEEEEEEEGKMSCRIDLFDSPPNDKKNRTNSSWYLSAFRGMENGSDAPDSPSSSLSSSSSSSSFSSSLRNSPHSSGSMTEISISEGDGEGEFDIEQDSLSSSNESIGEPEEEEEEEEETPCVLKRISTRKRKQRRFDDEYDKRVPSYRSYAKHVGTSPPSSSSSSSSSDSQKMPPPTSRPSKQSNSTVNSSASKPTNNRKKSTTEEEEEEEDKEEEERKKNKKKEKELSSYVHKQVIQASRPTTTSTTTTIVHPKATCIILLNAPKEEVEALKQRELQEEKENIQQIEETGKNEANIEIEEEEEEDEDEAEAEAKADDDDDLTCDEVLCTDSEHWKTFLLDELNRKTEALHPPDPTQVHPSLFELLYDDAVNVGSVKRIPPMMYIRLGTIITYIEKTGMSLNQSYVWNELWGLRSYASTLMYELEAAPLNTWTQMLPERMIKEWLRPASAQALLCTDINEVDKTKPLSNQREENERFHRIVLNRSSTLSVAHSVLRSWTLSVCYMQAYLRTGSIPKAAGLIAETMYIMDRREREYMISHLQWAFRKASISSGTSVVDSMLSKLETCAPFQQHLNPALWPFVKYNSVTRENWTQFIRAVRCCHELCQLLPSRPLLRRHECFVTQVYQAESFLPPAPFSIDTLVKLLCSFPVAYTPIWHFYLHDYYAYFADYPKRVDSLFYLHQVAANTELMEHPMTLLHTEWMNYMLYHVPCSEENKLVLKRHLLKLVQYHTLNTHTVETDTS